MMRRSDIDDQWALDPSAEPLRLVTCGGVDDGKSTLVGRLIYESDSLPPDQLSAWRAESSKKAQPDDGLDFSLLVDSLAVEREQRITIDVAYRHFASTRRNFVVADTPGHEQYTRNMVTGASTSQLAVMVIDARTGVLLQTRRHAFLASLLGIRHVVVAVNKMDLVDFSSKVFNEIRADFAAFAQGLSFQRVVYSPVSALQGDNVSVASSNMPWYAEPTLMAQLESIDVEPKRMATRPFRMPVQWVNRPSADFRGFAGTIVSGVVKAGDAIRAQPSGKTTSVARIVTADGDLEHAVAGQAVTLTLSDEIDISRGDVISHLDDSPACADQFECTIVWMHEVALLPGRTYELKFGKAFVSAQVTEIKYQFDVANMTHLAAKRLALNAIGVCNLGVDRLVPFDAYADNPAMGGFILLDRFTHETVGMGMLHFALRRSQNVHLQAVDVDKDARSRIKGQRACVIWLTGLSGSGKSAIANALEKRLLAAGRHTYLLDGDNVRRGLNKDLGFTEGDRVENIRRVAEVCRLMVDAGLIVIGAFISPFRAERLMARNLVADGEFMEVHVDTPLEVAEQRDSKGLYRKARRGELKNFTGIDSPYEQPVTAELRIETVRTSAEQAADEVIRLLRSRGVLPPRD